MLYGVTGHPEIQLEEIDRDKHQIMTSYENHQ